MKKKKRKNKAIFRLKNINHYPGEVIYVGEKESFSASFEVITYNEDFLNIQKTTNLQDVLITPSPDKITWININGLSDIKTVTAIGKHFGIHSLVLEDIVNTRQRPKMEEYEHFIFIVLKMLSEGEESYKTEHIAIVTGQDYVLTFQESDDGDVFDGLRERISTSLGRIRSLKSDYLMYTLLDTVIDYYFLVVEDVGTRIEELENNVFEGDTDEKMAKSIQNLRPQVINLRRVSYPVKEITGKLEKTDHPLIAEKTFKYLRDLHDNSLQVAENIEIFREMMLGLMDMYLSTINNKMNEVMKVLTVIATIFIPLTFLTGIYGMNFVNMPELNWKYGYFYVLSLIAIVVLGMLWYFKKKRWW